jgi:aerobic-type carbon monoxide dehydrogenase small subunit (CoxS/CutS family)
MEKLIRFNLNGKEKEITLDPELNLLWVLRDQFGLTGTKYGCGIGVCGACTILLDKEAIRSCTLQVKDVAGRDVLTIEGLASNGELHPVQKAFMNNDALQCGYCTPGMIMNATGLLLGNPEPTRQEIIYAMEDNLCRCGAHIRIIKAIQEAGLEMKKATQP